MAFQNKRCCDASLTIAVLRILTRRSLMNLKRPHTLSNRLSDSIYHQLIPKEATSPWMWLPSIINILQVQVNLLKLLLCSILNKLTKFLRISPGKGIFRNDKQITVFHTQIEHL